MALIKCPECEKEISDQANRCIHCGYPITRNDFTNYFNVDNMKEVLHKKNESSENYRWWKILCFFVPVAGVILFFVFYKQEPEKARVIMVWTLIGIAVTIGLYVLYVVLAIILAVLSQVV